MYSSLSPFSSGMGYGGYGGGYGGYDRPIRVEGDNNEAVNGQQPPPEQRNLRNEYNGMISGMSSILQLGYAGISMVVFTKNLTSIIKTSYNFLKQLFQRFGHFIFSLPVIRLLPKLLDKIRTESSSMASKHDSVLSKLILLLRVVTAGCIFALLYIKNQMQIENEHDIEKLTVELQQEDATLQQKIEEVKFQKEGFF